MPAPERARFDLEIERIRLLAMLAIGHDDDVVERIEVDLAAVEHALPAARTAAPRADRLFDGLGLGPDERDLVWAAVAANHPHVAPHLIVLGGAEVRRGLTLAVFAAVAFLDRSRAADLTLAMHAGHALLRRHLLVAVGDGTVAMRAFIVPARVIGFLSGDDTPDEALRGVGGIVRVPDSVELDARQRAVHDQVRVAASSIEPPLLVVEGMLGVGRRTAIACATGREVVALDLRRLDLRATDLEPVMIALLREAYLRDAIPLVADLDELIGPDADAASAFRVITRLLDEMPGPAAVTALQAGLEIPTARAVLRLGYPAPELDTRRALWRGYLGFAELDVDELAYRYGVGAGGIERAIASARLLAGGAPLTASHLVHGLRMNIAERLGDLAHRVEVTQGFDDLVLAQDTADQIEALIARVRHAHRVLTEWGFARKIARGQGVAALFSGPPGTGKTMVAGLIARELGLELYQVDLSKVVSKWIGETEKQLARVFDAAEAGHALLLFDEADALFARRTEVKGAVDRYANLEVNYLLQRIESYGGVVILTTNLDASIDPALRRRLAGHVVFWPPDEGERTRLWRSMLDARAPMACDVDCAALAERWPEMTGANIRNAALAAAFLAASRAQPISQAHLDRAARGEYRAMGRVLGDALATR